jgi:hypothetical protein
MKNFGLVVLAAGLFFLTGCYSTRSISDSGYERNYAYRGEIKEMDLVGSANETHISEADIKGALKESALGGKLMEGAKVLVMQSGAVAPDLDLLDELNGKGVAAIPFSGVPTEQKSGFNKTIRLAAARGGIRQIVCYWGVLESARRDRSGKVVSWIPVAGMFVPDERQQLRIRLKAIVMDVESGNWTMVAPAPIEDSALSAMVTRETSDQKQVEELKRAGYRALAGVLVGPRSS